MISYAKETTYNLIVDLPKTLICSSLKTIPVTLGVVASALSVLSGGIFEGINNTADNLTQIEHSILSKLYFSLIRVINPNFNVICPRNVFNTSGIISKNTTDHIFLNARKAYDSDLWIERHVFSRLWYAAGACTSPITRTTDVAIGVLAAAASIIRYAGRSAQVNHFAIQQLNLFVVDDFCKGIRGMVNPKQFD
jgi:hypothetical protein